MNTKNNTTAKEVPQSRLLTAIRRHREHKRQLQEKMNVRLAELEEQIKQDNLYLYYDIQ